MRSERTFSFISPLPSPPEERIEPVIPSRQASRRKTSIPSPPIVERVASSVYSTSPEPQVSQQMSRRKPTIAPLREPTPMFEPEEPLHIDLEEPPEEVDFQPPVERVRRATTAPQDEEVPEVTDPPPITSSTSENVEEPTDESVSTTAVSRQSTRRASVPDIKPEPDFEPPVMRMARSMTQPSQRQSVKSPLPIPEESVDEPTISRTTTRQPAQKLKQSELDPDFEPPVMRMARSMSRRETLRSPSPVPEEPAEVPTVSRVVLFTTRRATEPVVIEPDEEDLEPPAMRMRTATQPPLRTPKPDEEELRQEPSPVPVLRKATTRAVEEREPSPEVPTRLVTTRRLSEAMPPPEPLMRKATTRRRTERIPSPESMVRRVTTRMPTESLSRPEPVARQMTRQPTAGIPSPEEVIRRVTTRRRTRPIEEPLAPPSSPSTEEEVQPDGEPSQELEHALPVSRAADVPSRMQTFSLEVHRQRTATTPREHTLRRQSTQPDEFALPASSSSYTASSYSLADDDHAVDEVAQPPPAETEEVEFIPPVESLRRRTTLNEPPVEEPHRQPTYRSSLILSRRSTAASPHPTFAERHATFEPTTATPSRRSTIMSDPTAVQTESPAVSRVTTDLAPTLSRSGTQGILKRPTRQSTDAELVPLPPSRQLTRQPTEPQMVALPPSRQVTRQRTGPQLIPLPASRQPTGFISRRSSEYDMPGLTQRNVEKSPEDEPTPDKQPSRRQTQVPPQRQSGYGMPRLIQRNVEDEAKEEEPVVERQPTGQRTIVSRRPTQVPYILHRRDEKSSQRAGSEDLWVQSRNRSMKHSQSGGQSPNPNPKYSHLLSPIGTDNQSSPFDTRHQNRGYTNPPGPARAAAVQARKDDYYPRLAPVVLTAETTIHDPMLRPSEEMFIHHPNPYQRLSSENTLSLTMVRPEETTLSLAIRGLNETTRRSDLELTRKPTLAANLVSSPFAPRNEEKTPNWFQMHLPLRRQNAHQEPVPPEPVAQEKAFSGPVRRDAHDDSQTKDEPLQEEEGWGSRNRTSASAREKSNPTKVVDSGFNKGTPSSIASPNSSSTSPNECCKIGSTFPQSDSDPRRGRLTTAGRDEKAGDEKAADKRPKQPGARPSLFPRRQSTTIYDSSSSDPNAIPQRSAKPGSGRKDSFFGQRSPAKRTASFFGRGKESTPGGAAYSKGPSRAPAKPAEQPKAQQPADKVGAKGVQGGSRVNPLKGRWGWEWGRG
ncbi:hypothetical protein EK21DRAFT_108090 [Setomelanomma holmii]|uniref:Uncharacterized protein n=1 Tax=Setomelanomma holmii TaxID=210430 RepID=A0A9P4LS71_9PLEO|nr:hypothetical protein EK21DRAFT_108090 [Setomelanomma holmii]